VVEQSLQNPFCIGRKTLSMTGWILYIRQQL